MVALAGIAILAPDVESSLSQTLNFCSCQYGWYWCFFCSRVLPSKCGPPARAFAYTSID